MKGFSAFYLTALNDLLPCPEEGTTWAWRRQNGSSLGEW